MGNCLSVNGVIAIIISVFSVSHFAYGKQGISVWVRKAGDYADGAEPGRLHEKVISLNDFKMKRLKTFDLQYEKREEYKGVYLGTILNKYKTRENTDLALLHFRNGMLIPVPLAEATKPGKSSRIFVAVQLKKNKKWSSKFPNVEKLDKEYFYRDPNPTTFTGNKMVAILKKEKFYFRNKNGNSVRRFSPWFHPDSLVAIELVNEAAYYQQFTVTESAKVSKGLAVFRARCQFCHGVRQVGASFGWDYVDPLKISEKRDKRGLHLFVKYPNIDSFSMGLKMPNQIDLKARETKYLWDWIDAVAKKKIKKYRP